VEGEKGDGEGGEGGGGVEGVIQGDGAGKTEKEGLGGMKGGGDDGGGR